MCVGASEPFGARNGCLADSQLSPSRSRSVERLSRDARLRVRWSRARLASGGIGRRRRSRVSVPRSIDRLRTTTERLACAGVECLCKLQGPSRARPAGPGPPPVLTFSPRATPRVARLPLTVGSGTNLAGAISCGPSSCLVAIETPGVPKQRAHITVLSARPDATTWRVLTHLTASRYLIGGQLFLSLAPSGDRAWLLATSMPAAGLMFKTVWASANGGRSWSVQASDTSGVRGSHGLPAAGYPNGIVADGSGAWISLSPRGNSSYLIHTVSRRSLWHAVALPRTAGFVTALPPVIAPGGVTVTAVMQSPTGGAEARAYRLHGGAKRWAVGPTVHMTGPAGAGGAVLTAGYGSEASKSVAVESSQVHILMPGSMQWVAWEPPSGASDLDWAIPGTDGSVWWLGMTADYGVYGPHPLLERLWYRRAVGKAWLRVGS